MTDGNEAKRTWDDDSADGDWDDLIDEDAEAAPPDGDVQVDIVPEQPAPTAPTEDRPRRGWDEDPGVATGGSEAEERLRGLVTFIAGNLIDDPGTTTVRSRQRGQSVHLSLSVPEVELGKVIGRQGRIARAIRTAVMISGSRNDVRATLDIES